MTKIDTVLLTICRFTIGGVVVAAPWWLGGVLPSTQVGLQYGILVAILLLSVRLLATRSPTLATDAVRIPVAMIPLFGFLLLGIAQYAFPANRQHGPPDVLPEISLPAIESNQLSLYPRATLVETTRYAAYVTVFVIVVCCFATAGSQRILYTVVALNGMALAFFGIVQRLSWNGKLFWSIELTHGGTPFASYVNRNNAAGYLNLALACAVGMLYATTRELRPGGPGIVARITQFIGQLNERFLLALVACGVIFVGILFSLSRGGLLAALVAILVTLAVTFKGKSRLHLLVASGAVALLLLASYSLINWLDPSRALESRFQEVVIDDISRNGRIQHWKIAIETGLDHGTTGTGLGTHRYSHLAYRRKLFEHWAVNADNQFVELFVDAGVIGIFLLLTEIALLWYAIRRVSRSPGGTDPIAIISVFALSSQLTIGVFDFGISLPGNAMTAAAVFAMLVARDLNLRRPQSTRGIPGMVAVVLLLLVVSGVSLFQLRTTAAADESRRSIDRFLSHEDPWNHTVSETDDLIRTATASLANDLDNAELHTAVAQLWMNRYRQQAYIKLDASEQNDRYSPEMIWDGTSPTILHRIASRQRLAGRSVEAIRTTPEILNNIPNAVKHFRLASAACPVLPYVDIDVARLAILADENINESVENPAGHCLNAVVRVPSDLSVLYSAGLIACYEESDDACFAVWRRYCELFPNAANRGQVHNRNMETMFTTLCERFSTDEIIDRVMPDNGKFFPRFLQTQVARRKFAESTLTLYEKMLSSVDAHPQPDSADWHITRATALAFLERRDDAIAEYRLSFVMDDEQMRGRLGLVQYLRSIGRLDEAYDEATICQSLNPDREDIAKLVDQLRSERHRQIPK